MPAKKTDSRTGNNKPSEDLLWIRCSGSALLAILITGKYIVKNVANATTNFH